MILPKLVRCKDHGASCCWVQLDGSHITSAACACLHQGEELCKIDGHALQYVLRHPMFVDEGICETA